MKVSNRLSRVPAYLFARVDAIKKELQSKGIDIIDLGIGDPDIPTPGFVTEVLREKVLDSKYHRYPPYSGIDEFKQAVADYYLRKFGVELDPKNEVVALIGSKEGIAHMFLSITDPEDYVIIPDPAYPVYLASARIAGCSIYRMNLSEKNGFLPDIDNIYAEIARKAKLLVVNYPNNPTGAEANPGFFKKVIDFGLKNDVVIVNDGAYLDIGCRGYSPCSIMQTPGAKDIAVEFGSLSKPYNMTGWRLGYVVGNREIIKKLLVVKTNFDSGQFGAVQEAGVVALNSGEEFIEQMNLIYEGRRNIVISALKKIGIKVYESRATFYVWFRVPQGFKSEEFASYVLEKTGVIITSGNAYGAQGEGYCRISLTVPEDLLEIAMKKISDLKF